MAGNDSNTVLLLPTLGDEGNTGHEVTVVGTPEIQSFNAESNSLVGKSGRFDGGDYLNVTSSSDFDFGSGDFTIEFWFNLNSLVTTGFIGYGGGVAGWNATNGHSWFVYYSAGTLFLNWYDGDASPGAFNSSVTLKVGIWSHIAMVNDTSGGTLKLYIDGIEINSGTNSTMVTVSTPTGVKVGTITSLQDPLDGHLAGLAVHKSAVYTSAFTPPKTVAEMTNDGNTKLLIDFSEIDHADNPSTVTDSSASTHTVTNVSSSVHGCSYSWDGAFQLVRASSEYLTVPDHVDFDFGTGDFVLDFWVKLDTVGISQYPLSKFDASVGWALQFHSDGTIRLWHSASAYVGVSWSPIVDVWYHVAIVRDSTNIMFFVDGTQVGTSQTANATYNGDTDPLQIGTYSTDSAYLDGLIDNVRIRTGTNGGWTGSFTPPVTITSDANTVLMLTPDGNSAIAGSNHDLTFTDGIVLSQEAPSGFISSYEFDGTGDFLEIADSSDWDIS